MLQTKQRVLRRFWYPFMPATALEDGPRPFTLLGTDIVLWRGEDGSLGCVRDRCCHRTTKLSRGFVEGQNIVCGYHGWCYSRSGQVVRIPQLDRSTAPEGLCVPAYQATERHGFVWVALAEPLTEIPDPPEATDPSFRKIDEFHEVWHCAAIRFVENVFDRAHIAFTHRGSFGDANDPVPVQTDVIESEWGFEVSEIEQRVVNRHEADTALRLGTSEAVRRQSGFWYMPFGRRLVLSYPTGLRRTLFSFATPMTDDSCMVTQICYRNDTEAEVSAEAAIGFDRRIFTEDREIVEATEFDVPLHPRAGEEASMPSDKPGLQVRRKLRRLLEAHGESERRAPPADLADAAD